MKVIINKYIPPKGYRALTLGPFIFKRENKILTPTIRRHEAIHWCQEREMLIIPFLLWYAIEFLIRYFLYRFNWDKAYYNISFEREAYINQDTPTYTFLRKPYSWVKYIFH